MPLADAPPTPTPIPQNAGDREFTVEEYENTLFDLLNLARAQNGLPPAERNAALDTAATLHSADMAEHDFFAHLSYDGRDFNTRLTEQGLFFTNGGETIYAGGDPYQAYHIWMGSKYTATSSCTRPSPPWASGLSTHRMQLTMSTSPPTSRHCIRREKVKINFAVGAHSIQCFAGRLASAPLFAKSIALEIFNTASIA